MTSPPRPGRRWSAGWSIASAGGGCWAPERCSRRWCSSALVVAAQAGAGAVLLVVLSALAGGLWPPIAPSVRALLRELVPDAKVRETAYALESVDPGARLDHRPARRRRRDRVRLAGGRRAAQRQRCASAARCCSSARRPRWAAGPAGRDTGARRCWRSRSCARCWARSSSTGWPSGPSRSACRRSRCTRARARRRGCCSRCGASAASPAACGTGRGSGTRRWPPATGRCCGRA